jgi:hypothetical protein
MGGRQLVNAPRSENLNPIDSRANANNPANAYAQYGNVGARSLATTGNILKVTNPDIFEPILRDQPNQMASNYFGQQTKHGAREMNTFVRDAETYDVAGISTHSFPIAQFNSFKQTVDAQGFTTAQNVIESRPMAQAQFSSSAQTQVDAMGFSNTSSSLADVVTGRAPTSLAGHQLDSAGFTQTQVAPIESRRFLQPAQFQNETVGTDSYGFTVG